MAEPTCEQSGGFNVLLSRLNELASQLSQQYREDVEAVLSENKSLRLTLAGRSAAKVVDIDNPDGGDESSSEACVLVGASETSAKDANERSSTMMKNAVEEVSTQKKYKGNLPATEANEMVQEILQEVETNEMDPRPDPRLGTKCASVEAPAEPQDIQEPPFEKGVTFEDYVFLDNLASVQIDLASSDTPNSPTRSIKKKHFQMRTPWIDQRDFDNVKFRDIMPEHMLQALRRVTATGALYVELSHMQRNMFFRVGGLSSLVVHPESRVRGWWVLACVALLLYDFVMVPIDVCFDMEQTAFIKAMDLTTTSFWTTDIAFTFFVGIEGKHAVEMNPSKIACSYLKSWFIFDLFLVGPDWMIMAFASDGAFGGQLAIFRMLRWGRLMRLLRMARLLRSGKLKPLMRRFITVFNVSKLYLQLVQAFIGLSLALVAFIHMISCFWYAVGNSSDDGWVSVNGLRSASVAQSYAASVHWSISRLHGIQTYYGMESVTDLVLDSCLIYVSLMLAAYYNGKVAAVAMTSANAQSLNLWKLSVLFVKKYKISPALDMRMGKFLECSAAGGALETAAEEIQLLESLPKTLQDDLLFEAREPFLSKKPFLKDLLLANSRVIHQITNEAIHQKVFVDDEIVFENGDVCQGMIFVMSGIMCYILGKSNNDVQADLTDSVKTREIKANWSLCEAVLWTHWEHIGSLCTEEESVSLVLSPSDFSNVVKQHRSALCYAYKYAKRFLWELNHSSDLVIDDTFADHTITIADLDTDMFQGTEYDHFMFLSHYKIEAGTEATLMRDLFQDILREDPNHSANNLRSPIFVDSEDLTDLSTLKEHVKGSIALVLLLTPGVLSRPWCLVEIVTAVNHMVNIVPVDIQRPGSKYNYPTEQFYADILDGKFLNQAAVDLLEGEGISLVDVEQAIRKVFLKIAVSFSPHKSKAVREAELHDILSRSSQDHLHLRATASSGDSIPSSPISRRASR